MSRHRRSGMDRRGTGALLLVVLIAVLIILLLYFAGGSGSYMNQVKQTRKSGRQMVVDIQTDQYTKLICIYRDNNGGKLPKSVEDMGDDASSFIDPWGGRVTFTIEEVKNGKAKVHYHSPGPDKEDGTPDDINKTDTLPY